MGWKAVWDLARIIWLTRAKRSDAALARVAPVRAPAEPAKPAGPAPEPVAPGGAA